MSCENKEGYLKEVINIQFNTSMFQLFWVLTESMLEANMEHDGTMFQANREHFEGR